MPGQLGNSAIAGHRTTYGQPFYRLDELAARRRDRRHDGAGPLRLPGDGQRGRRRRSQSDVIATTDPTSPTLTLTTCHPRYTAPQPARSSTPTSTSPRRRRAAAADRRRPTGRAGDRRGRRRPTPPADDPVVTTGPVTDHGRRRDGDHDRRPPPPDDGRRRRRAAEPTERARRRLRPRLVQRRRPRSPRSPCGASSLSAIAIGAWLLSRRVRRNWVGALVGIVPFVVALYFFFQNVNRLLPAAL